MNNAPLLQAVGDPQIKAVSFDIFDTLLVRPCWKPTSLFRIVGRRCGMAETFEALRVEAERLARLQRPPGEEDVTLDDIYAVMAGWQTGQFTPWKLEQLKRTELEVEEEYLAPREAVRQAYQQALEAGKTVVIISDMYLPQGFLQRVLEKNGYTGHQKLYVSSYYKLSKGSGRLFALAAQDLREQGILPQQVLHVGDNPKTDIDGARRAGFRTFHAVSAAAALQSMPRYRCLVRGARYKDNSFLVGWIANRWFDPLASVIWQDSYFDGRLECMMDLALTPFLFSFVKWMVDDCRANGVQTLALVWRDGYIVDRILSLLRPCCGEGVVPRTVRIDLSRRALMGMNCEEANGLLDYLVTRRESAAVTLGNFLRRVACLPQEELPAALQALEPYGYHSLEDPIGDTARQLRIIRLLQGWFEERAAQDASAIKAYLRRKLEGRGTLAVFDIGYRGRVCRLLQEHVGIPCRGYHLISYAYVPQPPHMHACVQLTADPAPNHNALLEDIFAEQIPSVERVEQDPVTGTFQLRRAGTFTFRPQIQTMQNALIATVADYADTWRSDLGAMQFDPHTFYTLYTDLLRTPARKDVMMLKHFSFDDDNGIGVQYSRWYAQQYEQLPRREKPAASACEYYRQQMGGFGSQDARFPGLERALQWTFSEVFRMARDSGRENYAFWLGANLSFDKGTVSYMKQLMARYGQFHWLLLSDAQGLRYARAYLTLLHDVLILPYSPLPNGAKTLQEMQVDAVPAWACRLLKDKPALDRAADTLLAMANAQKAGIGRGLAILLTVYYYRLFTLLFEKLHPKKAVIWCQFMLQHRIMELVCQEQGLPPVYIEFGLLPGTLNIETAGQMGESFAARYPERFQKITLEPRHLQRAQDLLGWLRQTGLNRNAQDAGALELEKLPGFCPGRPVIVYFGHSDFNCGIYPYTRHARLYHSPVWASSAGPLAELARLARKHDWNLLYKPHPADGYYGTLPAAIPSRAIVLERCDLHALLDAADVAVTILSQVSYEALIRQRPTVLLGYNQLRGKGCAYECYSRSQLEDTLLRALEEGLTPQMRQEFVEHVARALKKFLYDDLQPNHPRYGKPLKALAPLMSRRPPQDAPAPGPAQRFAIGRPRKKTDAPSAPNAERSPR